MNDIQSTEQSIELQPLSHKHQRVLDQYVLCWNQTKAYMSVYQDIPYDSAAASATRLFGNVNFQGHLKMKLDELHMSADEAFKLHTDIARGDITQAMDVSGMGFSLDMKKVAKNGMGKLIKKVRQKTTTYLAKSESQEDREVHEIEIELYNAQEAQREILKMRGKYPANSRRENAPAVPDAIIAPPAALMELVALIERRQSAAVDAARAIPGEVAIDTRNENDGKTENQG